MGVLHYPQLLELAEAGVITNVSEELINGTSIDITLGPVALLEQFDCTGMRPALSLKQKHPVATQKYLITPGMGLIIEPGEIMWVSSQQVFHLPAHISALYRTKSSMMRVGLAASLDAGWCDAGWHGSCLTLALHNCCQHHKIELALGDRIGQVIFFAHEPVSEDVSYAQRGRYNHDQEVSGAKPDPLRKQDWPPVRQPPPPPAQSIAQEKP